MEASFIPKTGIPRILFGKSCFKKSDFKMAIRSTYWGKKKDLHIGNC